MTWASNSADDPTFDALIEQAELDALWEATAPDNPAARGKAEDTVHADPRKDRPPAPYVPPTMTPGPGMTYPEASQR